MWPSSTSHCSSAACDVGSISISVGQILEMIEISVANSACSLPSRWLAWLARPGARACVDRVHLCAFLSFRPCSLHCPYGCRTPMLCYYALMHIYSHEADLSSPKDRASDPSSVQQRTRTGILSTGHMLSRCMHPIHASIMEKNSPLFLPL